MVCLSLMTIKLFLSAKMDEKTVCQNKIIQVFAFLTCPLPLFLFSLARLLKLIVQFVNPGQTICMENYLNPDKPPLGLYHKIFVFKIDLYPDPMLDLKLIDGRYEIWATGSIASCDYAGMIFGYGYKVAGFVVPIGVVSVFFLGTMFLRRREIKMAQHLMNSPGQNYGPNGKYLETPVLVPDEELLDD